MTNPSVRDIDDRIVRLVVGNAIDPHFPHDQRLAARGDLGGMPRAWCAKGYEPVTALISAWLGRNVDPGVVRNWWRFDLAAGRSRFLPPPDAIVKRKGGHLLPGWADKTIRHWLSSDTPHFKSAMNANTYLAWDETNNEIDPRVMDLLGGNYARDHPSNPPVDAAVEIAGHSIQIPGEYLTLGYDYVAQLATELGVPMVANTVTHYWREDMFRVDLRDGTPEPYSAQIAAPDVIIVHGTRTDILPGWTAETVERWLANRPGSGNHTSGEFRRGYNGGRKGMRLVDGVMQRVDPVTV